MNRKFASQKSPNGFFKKAVSSLLTLFVALALTLSPEHARAQEPIREFVLAASYGVLAGTLVGAAALAFSDRPGDNLNKVARGASLGLYAGILLGFYIVYGVPSESEEEPIVWNLDESSGAAEGLSRYRLSSNQTYLAPREPLASTVWVAPVIGEKGIEGAQAGLRVYSF